MTNDNIFILSIKDFFSLKMLKFSIAPFFMVLILVYTIVFYFAHLTVKDLRHASFHVHQSQSTIVDGLETIDTTGIDFQGSSALTFLMSHALTSWIVAFLIYTIGSMLALILTIFISLIVITFLTPFILKNIHQQHYSDIEMKGYDNFFWSIIKIFRWFVIMVTMFFLFIPFYFVPILNVIMFNLPMYYFFHKILTYDVASNISTKNEYKKIMFFAGTEIRIKTFFLYLVSLIPFAVLFIGVYYIIFMGHTYFREIKELRTNEGHFL